MENREYLKINTEKFETFISNLFNELEKTDSFIIADDDLRNSGIDIYSTKSKIALKIINESFTNYSSNILKIIQSCFEKINNKELNFNKFILVSTFEDNDFLFEYLQLLKSSNHYPFEIELWNWEIITKHLKSYEYLLKNHENIQKTERNLTTIPDIKQYEIFGFETLVNDIDRELEKQNYSSEKLVIFNILEGSGKSSLIKYYLKLKQFNSKYSHLAWINSCGNPIVSLFNSFQKLYKYNQKFDIYENLYKLKTKLNNIEGNNLLVLDNIKTIHEYVSIEDFFKGFKWKVVITSNYKLQNCNNFQHQDFNLQTSQQIIKYHCKNIKNEIILQKILERVNYNPHAATLFGKFLNSNKQISENELFNMLIEKDSRIPHLKNYINENATKEEIFWQKQNLKYTQAVFEEIYKNLNFEQKKLLTSLCFFPDKEFTSNELTDVLNIKKNEIEFVYNELLELISKNIIIALKDKFYLSPTLKKILHKKLKPTSLKLKTPIENIIKKSYDYNSNFYVFINYIPYYENLIINFRNENRHTGILTNNLAVFYENIGDYDTAKTYYLLTIEIEEKFLDKSEPDDDVCERIAKLYIKIKDYPKAEFFAELSLKHRKSNYDENHVKIADINKLIAIIYEKMQLYEKAIEFIENAIDIYKENLSENDEIYINAQNLHEFISNSYIENQQKKDKWNWLNKYFR